MATSTSTYANPYISLQIYDNTEYIEEETVEERKEFNGMQVGFFAGGRDNQLLYIPSRSSYLKEYCNPNFRKLGQAAYNADNALATDSCGMYIMNLRPDTATHANAVVMVKFKILEVNNDEPVQNPDQPTGGNDTENTENGETVNTQSEVVLDGTDIGVTEDTTPTKKLVYSFYSKTIENATSEDSLLSAALELMETDPDENGYYNMPLAVFYALGRGDFGNGIHLVFSNATEYANDDDFYEISRPVYHVYTLTTLESSANGLTKRDTIYGNFDEDGFDPEFTFGPSTLLSDNINDIENGSVRIRSEIYSATLEAMCKLYNDTFNPAEERTASNLDILTGLTLDGVKDENLELDETPEDYLNLFSLDGFTLKSGSDGWGGMTEDEIREAKDELLIKAYSGDIDPVILSRFSSPCNFNLDANYSVPVKRQMAALANRRLYDLMTYLDLGTTTTTSSMIAMLTSLKNVYGFNIIKEGHTYKYRDIEYTGKVCQMTITHWLAKALPTHMAMEERGLYMPLCRDTAILRSGKDYVPGSFKPVIDPDSNDIKNTIYRLRGNCYETLTYNSVQRSTAITTCQAKSDRLLEMNEYILQKGVKCIYDCLSSRIYKLGESSDRSQFEEDATDIVETEIGDYVRAFSVSLEMTPEDEKKSLLRIKVHITFKTVIQNGDIEIYLDPRVTDEVVSTTTVIESSDEE